MHLADIGDYSRRGGIGILYLLRKGRRAKDLSVVLVEDLADSVDLYLRLRGKQKATDPLFFSERPDRKGARLSVRGIRAIISSYMKKAGIDRPHVSPHSARHHAATNALLNGASLKDVQEMLGHATIATTENYIHLAKRLNDGAEHRVQIGKKADLSAVAPAD
jgi:site-specific recombinase XerD